MLNMDFLCLTNFWMKGKERGQTNVQGQEEQKPLINGIEHYELPPYLIVVWEDATFREERWKDHEKHEEIAEFAVDYYQRMVTAEHRMQIKEEAKENRRW